MAISIESKPEEAVRTHAEQAVHYSTGSVISRDGTTIGYRQYGRSDDAPGLVILHGTMSSGYHHDQLASLLADAFTVYVPDRRGRGLSGPYSKDFSIQTEVEDLAALLEATGAHNVFGVSSGGIITLQAARTLPPGTIRKAAINEPPLTLTRKQAAAVLARYDSEVARGNVAAALITGMKGAKMGPPMFNFIPRPLLVLMVDKFMRSDEKKGKSEYVPMRELGKLMHYDFSIVVEMSDRLEIFKEVDAQVLLIGGSKSPAYLKQAHDKLERILPHVRRVEIPGLDHAASWNSDMRGHPGPLALELRRFFL